MKEANIIVDDEFKRNKSNVLKLNNAFSAENIKDISDKIHCYGKYADSDCETDESIHYEPGHGLNCYSSDESRSKKKKANQRKTLQKKFRCKISKRYLWFKKINNTKKIIRRRLKLIMQIVTMFSKTK